MSSFKALISNPNRALMLGLLAALCGLMPLMANQNRRNIIEVELDNQHIQTYRGRLGVWHARSSESLSTVVSRNGTTLDEVRKINDGQLSGVVFVPMSLERYERLIALGHGRRVLKMDKRSMLWPVEKISYTSRFGPRNGGMHTGLDLACAPMSVVLAAEEGVVTASGWHGAMGNAVAIQHSSGLVTWYGHNTVLLLKKGEQVKRGQAIALSGNTGRSTGPHVHFEVRYMNVAMNPEDFLQATFQRPNLVQREVSPLDTSTETSLRVDAQDNQN